MTSLPLDVPPAGVDESHWAAACSAIRRYCGWHIAPEVTATLTLDGPGGSLLRLPSMHVTDVLSVTNDGDAVTDPEWSANGLIRGCWTSKFRGVVVTFTHGYEVCPSEIYAVAAQMSQQASALSESVPANQLTAGPFTYQMPSSVLAGAVGLSGQHRGVLDRYKLAPSP